MDLSFFKDKKITVFGLGLHGGGVATVRFLSEHGARVIATDIKNKQQLAVSLEKLEGLKNVEFVLGQHRQEDFTNVDMVIKNPAIPWSDKHVQLALEKNIPVEMDSSIFFALCKNQIIGITGSKGKTTTATLIQEILNVFGKHVVKVGIGQEPVLDKLALLKKETIVVFELSSWRLSALGRMKKSPHVAVITNIMRDHLNYYKSMEKYIADKKNIFSHQTLKNWLVYNCEDERLSELAVEAKSQKVAFCSQKDHTRCNVYIEDNAIYLNDGIDVKKVLEIAEIRLAGTHNQKNIMAAIGAGYATGVDVESMRKAIRQFSGIKHRLEFVRELDGVRYYNDTAATIPDAAMLSMNSFVEPLVLIAGGSDKELEFSEFAKKIVTGCKKAILLVGTATDKIISELDKLDQVWRMENVEIANSMQEAIEKAKLIAKEGDVILLSPGAASFGMFENEFDRGDQFRERVMQLKK